MSNLLLFLLLLTSYSAGLPEEDQWMTAVTAFEHLTSYSRSDVMQAVNRIASDDSVNISSVCRSGLRTFSADLKGNQQNAMLMFNSFSKHKSGFLTYRDYDFGSLDQCLPYGRFAYLGVNFPLPKDPSTKKFSNEHKDWRIEWSNSISPRRLSPFPFCICLPHECSETDIMSLFNTSFVSDAIKPLSLTVMSTESSKDSPDTNFVQKLSLSALSSILWLGITSALINHMSPNLPLSQWVKPFDAVANLKTLFAPVQHADSKYLSFNIFRCGYLIVSIFLHLFIGVSFTTGYQAEAFSSIADRAGDVSFSNIVFSGIPADMVINFIPAACFAALKVIPLISRNQNVSLLWIILERALRTLPVMVTCLLLIQVLPMFFLGNGPLSKYILTEVADVCYRNGWSELLFVSSLNADLQQICFPVAWFFSTELQMLAASLLTLLVIAKAPKYSTMVLTAHIVIGVVASGYFFHVSRILPVSSLKTQDLYGFVSTFPAKVYHPINYIAVYPIGIILALKLAQSGPARRQMSAFRFWGVVSAFFVIHLLPVIVYENGRFLYGPFLELVFASLIRFANAACLGMLFYALVNCEHWIVVSMARSRFVTISSRLLLSWYISHAIGIILLFASYDSSGVTFQKLLMEFLFITVISFVPACIMYAFVESPFNQILSMYVKRNRQRCGSDGEGLTVASMKSGA